MKDRFSSALSTYFTKHSPSKKLKTGQVNKLTVLVFVFSSTLNSLVCSEVLGSGFYSEPAKSSPNPSATFL